jgi:2-oxoglutarate ferredoxin oxidoreductase subunit alpha
VPGMEGFAHRNGGLEKDYDKGSISTDPKNHQKMVDTRQAKIEYIANFIPDLEVKGDAEADLLVVGWGGTHGHIITAVNALNRSGKKVAMAHFNYIYPLPKNTEEVFKKYKKIIVCELNGKQFALHLRSHFNDIHFETYNKIEGQPFTISQLKNKFLELL